MKNEAEVQPALKSILQFDNRLLVEKFISGREFTIGMANGQLLPPLEIISPGNIFDFHAKYESNKTIYECPPSQLSSGELEEMSDLAMKTFKAFNCVGLGRDL